MFSDKEMGVKHLKKILCALTLCTLFFLTGCSSKTDSLVSGSYYNEDFYKDVYIVVTKTDKQEIFVTITSNPVMGRGSGAIDYFTGRYKEGKLTGVVRRKEEFKNIFHTEEPEGLNPKMDNGKLLLEVEGEWVPFSKVNIE